MNVMTSSDLGAGSMGAWAGSQRWALSEPQTGLTEALPWQVGEGMSVLFCSHSLEQGPVGEAGSALRGDK